MRRITIEYGESGDRACSFDVIDEYGRCCDGLSWDELLGHVATMTHPRLDGRPLYRMQTTEEWQDERAKRYAQSEERRRERQAEEATEQSAMLDALRQWQNAERDDDAEELENARRSRDELVTRSMLLLPPPLRA